MPDATPSDDAPAPRPSDPAAAAAAGAAALSPNDGAAAVRSLAPFVSITADAVSAFVDAVIRVERNAGGRASANTTHTKAL